MLYYSSGRREWKKKFEARDEKTCERKKEQIRVEWRASRIQRTESSRDLEALSSGSALLSRSPFFMIPWLLALHFCIHVAFDPRTQTPNLIARSASASDWYY